MKLIPTLTGLLALPLLSTATGPSSITAPANGTHVAPGAKFPFSYRPLGDYCQSSFDIVVFVYTSKPKPIAPAQTWATGSFIGKYSTKQGSKLPTSLTMPDFSQSPGGFGVGKTASNLPVYLTVFEDTGTCEPALGTRIALREITLIYNATKSD